MSPPTAWTPQGIRWQRDLLRSLAAQGRAVLVSSHILAEVAQTADDVVIIHHGRTVTQAPLPDLLAARHLPAGVSGAVAAAIIAIATALCAALGVGVGAIIRNQAGAVTAVLALVYVADPPLGFIPPPRPRCPGIRPRRPARRHPHRRVPRQRPAARAPSCPGTQLPGQPAAALILAGYATAAVLAGAALLRRRDITT